MPKTAQITIDVRGLNPVVKFVNTIQEIAGTTNDPDTATNLRAAIHELQEGL